MENRSFNQIYLEWEKAKKELKSLMEKTPKGTPAAYKAYQKRLELHANKLTHFTQKLYHFGEGSVIEITGKVWVEIGSYDVHPVYNPPMEKLKNFKLLLVNTDLENAEKYLKVLIESYHLKVDKETIKYKELQTGEFQII